MPATSDCPDTPVASGEILITKLTLHEIHSLGGVIHQKRVTLPLPFEVMNEVAIEDVSGFLTDETLDWVSKHLGIYQTETLKSVRFALVHRYTLDSSIMGTDDEAESEKLIKNLIELIHIIRPMRQDTSIVRGQQSGDNFRVVGLETPTRLEVPEVQKSFHLRNQDLHLLKQTAPLFIQAMQSAAMKFRTAVAYHNVGRLVTHGNARFLLWCSALEALYTSHTYNHQGSLVATERIKWFLGPQTQVYEEGDVPDFILNQPHLTVADIVTKIYEVRNFIAHGDVLPRKYFETTLREGVAGDVATIEVLGEALSFIVRKSLLRILRDDLFYHFKTAATTDAFFGAQGLTRSLLKKGIAEALNG
jgi:hypothetical protein